jgi:hypothetical protein
MVLPFLLFTSHKVIPCNDMSRLDMHWHKTFFSFDAVQ